MSISIDKHLAILEATEKGLLTTLPQLRLLLLKSRHLFALASWLLAITASATVRYVDINSASPTPPYTSWSTAATNIQDALGDALAGDEVVVTNGVYATGELPALGDIRSRVTVPAQVSLRSVNGPQFTFIVGGGSIVIRCVKLGSRASLTGFTLTNGTATYNGSPGSTGPLRGGGVYCNTPVSTNYVISNCVLIANSSDEGGGAYGGTLINCTLTNNSARYGGGGAHSSRLINCILTGNQSTGGLLGGGVYNSLLTNCTLANNSAILGMGAGANGSTLGQCTLTGCTLIGNGARNCNIYNCTLTGSPDYGAALSFLYNCTLTSNYIGAFRSSLRNCIIYDNYGADYEESGLRFCCTRVMPTSGIGNITNAPLFVAAFVGNLRLQSNSPCINAGDNAYAAGFTDFDGNPRIAGGTVDIGAYEFQAPSSVLSYAWAQQYGLPTDGSADYSDADTDLMNNWQEWIAGTVPTDAASALRLLTPTPGMSGTIVSWQSVSNRTYFLERGSDLGAQPSFSLLKNNIVGQEGLTSFTDTNAAGPGPFFYRVGVQ